MECPRDALGRNECFMYFETKAGESIEELWIGGDTTIEDGSFVVSQDRPPHGAMSAQQFTCPHGNKYWIGERVKGTS